MSLSFAGHSPRIARFRVRSTKFIERAFLVPLLFWFLGFFYALAVLRVAVSPMKPGV